MPDKVAIAVLGDWNPENPTHKTISTSLDHAIPGRVEAIWIASEKISSTDLSRFDGVFCAPQSPYRDMEGILAGICYARENDVPFFGTCAGFQHSIIEIARNLLNYKDATSAEYDSSGSHLFVSRLACSLVGKRMEVQFTAGSLAESLYGVPASMEDYYCNFGLNPDYIPELESVGARITGVDQDGEARIMELPDRRFHVTTLFVPQTNSAPGRPHPLIAGFARAAGERKFRAQTP